MSGSYNPGKQASRFVLFRFRSPLPAESLLISSPAGTEMFHFPACRLLALFDSGQDSRPDAGWVAPFGNPRIESCRQSPGIFAVNCALRRLTMPRHPSCARIRLIGKPISTRYTLQFFTQNYAVFKEHPSPARGGGPDPPSTTGKVSRTFARRCAVAWWA